MTKSRLNLRKVVAIAICLAGFSVGNVLAQDNTTDQGVVINGVKWATRNVDKPGTFAANPEAMGMFYQWNRKVGWSSTAQKLNSNGGTTWETNIPIGDSWEKANDPSPVGWRVPTLNEINKLLDNSKVNKEWTTLNGINGWKFTDITTKNSIFLTAAGCRNKEGTLENVGVSGHFWSSTKNSSISAYGLGFSSYGAELGWNYGRRDGFSIRSVAE